jgi:hypothetical protein
MREMSKFAVFNFIGSASGMISGYGSGIILNHFHGTILNTANAITGQLNGQFLALSSTMLKALNPTILKSEGEGNRSLLIKSTLIGCKISFLLFAFLTIPFLIETPFILELWLIKVPIWAVLFCKLGTFATLIDQVTITFGIAISAVGVIKNFNINFLFLSILNLGTLVLLFYYGFSPTYLYILGIIGAILSASVKIFYANKFCGITYILFFKELFFPLLLVFVISLAFGLIPHFFINNPSFFRLIWVAISAFTTFILSTYIFVFTKYEKHIFYSFMKSSIYYLQGILKKKVEKI